MGVNIVRVRRTNMEFKRFIKCNKFYSGGYLTGLPMLLHNNCEYLNQEYDEEIG
ncbi:MAG: hypothetical protein ACFFBC_00080 [Promethearchaeota archaeon]